MRLEGSAWDPLELQKREGTARRNLCFPQHPLWELDPSGAPPHSKRAQTKPLLEKSSQLSEQQSESTLTSFARSREQEEHEGSCTTFKSSMALLNRVSAGVNKLRARTLHRSRATSAVCLTAPVRGKSFLNDVVQKRRELVVAQSNASVSFGAVGEVTPSLANRASFFSLFVLWYFFNALFAVFNKKTLNVFPYPWLLSWIQASPIACEVTQL